MYLLSESALGSLSLGTFVGFVLGYGLILGRKPQIRGAVTIVGCALGGAPLYLLRASNDLWMYPVGLLLGLLVMRVMSARQHLSATPVRRSSASSNIGRLFAWLDIALISAFAFGCVAYALMR